MNKKYFKILITGSENYNNKFKLIKTLNSIYKYYTTNFNYILYIATFGTQYGAQYIAKQYCVDNNIKYGEFTPLHKEKTEISVLNHNSYNKTYNNSLYYINISKAYRWLDIGLIFSNQYTNEIETLLKFDKRNKNKNNKEILLIKQ